MKITQAELETMTLGMMCTHRDSAAMVLLSGATEECFTQKADQTIFEAVKYVFINTPGRYGISDIKAKVEISLHDRIKEIFAYGGYFPNHQIYITELIDRQWARTVNDTAHATHAMINSQLLSPDRKRICDATMKLLETALHSVGLSRGKDMAKMYYESCEEIEKNLALKDSGGDACIKTPFKKLNMTINGLSPGRFYIIGARPGVGKTTFALNLVSAACKQGKHVTFVSLEMKAAELHKKLVSENGKVSISAMLNSEMNDYQFDKFQSTSLAMKDWKLHVFDDGRTFEEIKMQAKLDKMAGKLDCLFIDYLTLLESSVSHKDIRMKVVYFTKSIKQMAMELNIPIIVLAQLNRNIEKNGKRDRPPMLSDLKESGSIEQDADVVMFIDRPAMYDESAKDSDAIIWLEKNRMGRTGDIALYASMDISSFLEIEND